MLPEKTKGPEIRSPFALFSYISFHAELVFEVMLGRFFHQARGGFCIHITCFLQNAVGEPYLLHLRDVYRILGVQPADAQPDAFGPHDLLIVRRRRLMYRLRLGCKPLIHVPETRAIRRKAFITDIFGAIRLVYAAFSLPVSSDKAAVMAGVRRETLEGIKKSL